MTYLDKYPNCNGCPVIKYCGTAVSCIKLCHSLDDSMSQKETTHVLTLSKAAPADASEYIEEKLTMWDNITD
jgi:hypothetical protein